MALATYSDLKQAIQDWRARSDLATKADDFIDLAEAFFNTRLRQLNMEKVGTLTTTATDPLVTLPADYLGLIKLSLASDPAPLEMVSLKSIDDHYLISHIGRPDVFALEFDSGTAKARFAPAPDSDYDLKINYYYGITPLSDANTTNWLLTKYPNIYLAACLYEAAKYCMDFEQAALYASEVNTLLTVLEAAGKRDRQSQQRINQRVVYGVV